jgi:hypothetical protein
MSADESKMYAKGLVDLANISAGALVFGHFAAQHVSRGLIILGIATTLALYFVAHLLYRVAGEREHK